MNIFDEIEDQEAKMPPHKTPDYDMNLMGYYLELWEIFKSFPDIHLNWFHKWTIVEDLSLDLPKGTEIEIPVRMVNHGFYNWYCGFDKIFDRWNDFRVTCHSVIQWKSDEHQTFSQDEPIWVVKQETKKNEKGHIGYSHAMPAYVGVWSGLKQSLISVVNEINDYLKNKWGYGFGFIYDDTHPRFEPIDVKTTPISVSKKANVSVIEFLYSTVAMKSYKGIRDKMDYYGFNEKDLDDFRKKYNELEKSIKENKFKLKNKFY